MKVAQVVFLKLFQCLLMVVVQGAEDNGVVHASGVQALFDMRRKPQTAELSL